MAELDLFAVNDVRRSANANTLEANLVNNIAQLDVGPLLNAGAQGQGASQGKSQGQSQQQGQGQTAGLRPAGPSDTNTSNVAGDLANQLAPEPGADVQHPASNDVAGDLANQIAEGGAAPTGQSQSSPPGQGQVAAVQGGGTGATIIEIKSTIIQEANGQQIATAVVEQQEQGQQPAAAPAPTEAPATTAEAPAPPAEAKPTEAPAAMPAPAEAQGESTAAEAAPKPETQPTQPPAEGMSAMVRIWLPNCIFELT